MFETIKKIFDPYEPDLVEWPVNILKACHQGKGGGIPPAPPPAPPAPDPYEVAQAQGAQNRAAAISQAEIAMVNQMTPFGGLEWSRRGTTPISTGAEGETYGGTPQYTAVQTLSPDQQRILDLSSQAQIGYGDIATSQLGAVEDRLSSPVDYTGIAPAPTINLEDFVGTAPVADFGGIPQAGQLDYSGVAPAPTLDYSGVAQAPQLDYSGVAPAPTLDYSGLGAAPQFDQAYQDQISQAIRDRADIWQTRDLDRLENRLTNQGINIGTEAWDREMGRYQTGINDFNLAADLQGLQHATQRLGAEQAARQMATGELGDIYSAGTADRGRALAELGSIYQSRVSDRDRALAELSNIYTAGVSDRDRAISELGNIYSAGASDRDRGIAEASQLFGLQANARDRAVAEASQLFALQAGARDRAINELMVQRNQPLNELAAMLSGVQLTQPQFLTPPQPTIAAGDLQGAQYANYQGALQQQAMQNRNNLIGFQAQQAQNNALTGGLFGLAGAGIMAYPWSDRRLKKNATIIGKLKNGLNVYSFNYIWENGAKQIGVMADEVKKVLPHAVHRRDGFDTVDYSEVLA